jgi:hypothetical protein
MEKFEIESFEKLLHALLVPVESFHNPCLPAGRDVIKDFRTLQKSQIKILTSPLISGIKSRCKDRFEKGGQ